MGGLLDPADLHRSQFLGVLEPLASPDENPSAVRFGVLEGREKFLTRHGGRSLGNVSHLRRHGEGNPVVGKIIHQPPEGIGRARGIEVPNDEKNPKGQNSLWMLNAIKVWELEIPSMSLIVHGYCCA